MAIKDINIDDWFQCEAYEDDFDEDLSKPSAEELKSAQKVSLSLVDSLSKGLFPVKINGVGIFQVEDLPGYEGRNPRTGELIPVPGRRIIVFRMDRGLKERVTKEVLK